MTRRLRVFLDRSPVVVKQVLRPELRGREGQRVGGGGGGVLWTVCLRRGALWTARYYNRLNCADMVEISSNISPLHAA